MTRSEYEFDPEAVSVRKARSFVRAALARSGLIELAEVAELLTSELVTNALLHAGSAFRVSVDARPPMVRVEVSDRSPADLPTPRRAQLDSEHGRGLVLVEELAAEWGYRLTGGGKVVWFVLASSSAARPAGRRRIP